MGRKKFKSRDSDACRTAKQLMVDALRLRKPGGPGSNTELEIDAEKPTYDTLQQFCTFGVPTGASDQQKVVCMLMSNACNLADLGVVVMHKDGRVSYDTGHANNKESKAKQAECRSFLKMIKEYKQDEPLLAVMDHEE